MQTSLAELVGTFVLVFGGCGSAVIAGDRIGTVGVSFAFGLSVLATVYAIGPISGCHINPAVTVGLLLNGRCGKGRAAGYVAAQAIGAVLAGGALLLIARSAAAYNPAIASFAANGYGAHSPGNYDLLSAFLTEALLTAFLVLTVLASTEHEAGAQFAGSAIAAVVTLALLVGIPVTNASINPARSFATAVVVGGWALRQLWLFIVAPLSGAVIAAGIYRLLQHPRDEVMVQSHRQGSVPPVRDELLTRISKGGCEHGIESRSGLPRTG